MRGAPRRQVGNCCDPGGFEPTGCDPVLRRCAAGAFKSGCGGV